MAIYSEDEIKLLRDRWEGHDEALQELITIIRTNPSWHESDQYKAIMQELAVLPSSLQTTDRDLRGVYLSEADLTGAKLWEVNLSGANLREANLSGANLEGANFTGTILNGANFTGARLNGANFTGANLWGANLSGAFPWEVNLSGANLREANLSGADLLITNLSGADLHIANFTGARLWEDNLTGANLREANLRGVMLARSNLEGANFANVKYSTNQILDQLINSRWILFLLRRIPVVKRLRNWERAEISDFRGLDTTKLDGSTNPLLKRYIEDYQFILGFKEKDWFHKYIFYPVWKVTADCGRSLFLWAFWSAFLAVAFGLIYAPFSCPTWFPAPVQNFLAWADPQIYIDPHTYQHHFWTSIYFSIVTFTTLGFGDVQPQNGAGLFWVGLEVIAGYIMLGGLISILANKLARRA